MPPVINVRFLVNIFSGAKPPLSLLVLRCVCSRWCVSARFQGDFAEECYRLFQAWGLALLCPLLSNLIYCFLADWNSQFASLVLPKRLPYFPLLLLPPPPPSYTLVHPFDWHSREALNSAESLKRRWMGRLKECESQAKCRVWVSLACGGAPLCWMDGWDKIWGQWHLWVKGWARRTEQHAMSVLLSLVGKIKKWNKHLKLFVQLMSVQMNINKPWINIERFLFLCLRSVCLRSTQTVAFLGRQRSRTVNIAAFAFMNRAACCKFRLVASRHLTVILGNMNGWYGWIPVKVQLMLHYCIFYFWKNPLLWKIGRSYTLMLIKRSHDKGNKGKSPSFGNPFCPIH